MRDQLVPSRTRQVALLVIDCRNHLLISLMEARLVALHRNIKVEFHQVE